MEKSNKQSRNNIYAKCRIYKNNNNLPFTNAMLSSWGLEASKQPNILKLNFISTGWWVFLLKKRHNITGEKNLTLGNIEEKLND